MAVILQQSLAKSRHGWGHGTLWYVGGEKSYTTVAFALALGEWTQSPFRAMDEFDVFMDAINRRVAMENLFGIFLTPQV